MPINSRSILALSDIDASDLMRILERSSEMAQCWRERRMPQSLQGKRIGLVVNDSGWRNTTAFDLGIQAMGGICVQPPLRWDTGEELNDLAAYLGNWFDAIVTRTPELATLHRLAGLFHGPVVNARTKQNHPCEILGDLAFYYHKYQTIEDIKVVVVSPSSNILGSWIEAAAVLPLRVVQVYPANGHDRASAEAIPRFSCSTDLKELIDANIVVTDCWPDNANAAELLDYQVTGNILAGTQDNVEFIPCPPVSRGKEVSAEAMSHPTCRVIEAKSFLMHAQNAVLEWVFGAG